MIDTVKPSSVGLELDTALRYAVTVAWEDLVTRVEPRAIRVEYGCDPGATLDHLSVWLVRARGNQDLVCDYWTGASSVHQAGHGPPNWLGL